MQSNLNFRRERRRILGGIALAVSLLVAAGVRDALAQTTSVSATNDKLELAIGSSANAGGTFGLAANTADPFGAGKLLLIGDLNRPATGTPQGTRLFVRVDGGAGRNATGYDYIFGDNGQPPTTTGTTTIYTEGGSWVKLPAASGNALTATWITGAVTRTTTISGVAQTSIFDPKIQITMTALLVNDTVRFEFAAQNLSQQQHTVQFAFIQDVNANLITPHGPNPYYAAPLRLPSRPYLKTEALLSSGQLPSYWETDYTDTTYPAGDPRNLHSIRGLVLPDSVNSAEPTTPTMFAYGDAAVLNGSYNAGTPLSRYANVWNFAPVTTLDLADSGSSTPSAGVGLYSATIAVSPSGTTRFVSYVGQATSTTYLLPPLGVSVTSLPSLQYNKGAVERYVKAGSTDDKSTFTITAYAANESDITPGYKAGVETVALTLTLPTGLKFTDGSTVTQTATGPSATQTITGLAAGKQQAVTWTVTPDTRPGYFQAGTLTYSLTATTSATPYSATGSTISPVTITRTVQRSIEIPAPLNFTIPGTRGANNQYRLVSFPYSSNGLAPSTTLRYSGLTISVDPNNFSLLQYNPTTGKYFTPGSITPGVGYWLRLSTLSDANISVDATTFKPLPITAPVTRSFSAGWNLISDPYVYAIRFSEAQITGTTSGLTVTPQDAITTYGYLSPTIYGFDSSSANQANWHYVSVPSVGFTMQPYTAYWVYFNTTVQVTYPIPDTPLGAVTP